MKTTSYFLLVILLTFCNPLFAEEPKPYCHVYYMGVLNANDSEGNVKKNVKVFWSKSNQCLRSPYKAWSCFSYFIDKAECSESESVKKTYVDDLRRHNLFLN